MEDRGRIPVGPPITKPLPSYWQDPKSPLANVVEPEVDKATQLYDYAIIGSGISGTMIAYDLFKKDPGSRIVMFEAREICSGATGRNGGHTKAASYRTYTQHVQELGKDEALRIARLEYANIVETHQLANDLDLACESQICNTVDLIYDTTTFEVGKTAIQALGSDATKEEGNEGEMAWYEIYDKDEALQQNFHVEAQNQNPANTEKEQLAGAFKYTAGRIHAYRFTTGVLKECVKKGLQLCANSPVHDILPSKQTAMWDVFTQFNSVTARNVILATNGYTPYVLKSVQGAIVPLRGQITVQKPGTASKLQCTLPTTYSFIYRNGYEYMIPRPLPDGSQHIVIGGGLGRLPDAGATEFGTVDDGSLNPKISTYLNGTLTGYFGSDNWGETCKEDEEKRVVQEWTGIMGATADGRPFVGEVPGKKGMWVSAGFNGHGMVLCLKAAEALVEMVRDGVKPDWFPESFLITPERLEQCKFRGRMDMQ
ncbi:FAD dependent oxidoreductase-like protein, partial [Dothidotthia symphoricarpi CBS 119687]